MACMAITLAVLMLTGVPYLFTGNFLQVLAGLLPVFIVLFFGLLTLLIAVAFVWSVNSLLWPDMVKLCPMSSFLTLSFFSFQSLVLRLLMAVGAVCVLCALLGGLGYVM